MIKPKSAGDKPGWLRLAWQFLRRPRLDPISMIGDNKSIMAFNLIWMFDKVCKLRELTTYPVPFALSELKDSMLSQDGDMHTDWHIAASQSCIEQLQMLGRIMA